MAEDDAGLRSVLERGLTKHGYVVDAVADGEQALRYLRTYEYEVAVLDWRIPGRSGVEVLRDLRQGANALPVLLLTARDTPADKVAGLDSGADDYLVKPFDFGELLARLRALQRRSSTLQPVTLNVGDLVFEPSTRRTLVGGRQCNLTAVELRILELLLRRSPGVVGRRAIALHVWEDEADALGSNTIDVHLSRLRAKLVGGRVKIETVRGVGYRIVAE
ncbi:MAG: response regulator transcription factor [Actinomycetota bacterium]|nr:response regulator transcription factor [Actinomycetota bacterium]